MRALHAPDLRAAARRSGRSSGALEGGEVPDRDTCVTWLIGRGLSIGCGLTWVVPAAWSELEREARIDRIKETLREEMNREYVDTKPIRSLLGILAAHTAPGWRHEFLTTNWRFGTSSGCVYVQRVFG